MTSLLIVIVLVLVNVIFTNHFFRADLTEDKQYTISKVSKEAVSKVDDIVTVKVFFTEDLPPALLSLSQYVKDMLSEFSAYSDGKLYVKYFDPALDEELQKEVQGFGIPQVQMNFLEKDKMEVRNGYLGIALFYGDKIEVIPVVSEPSGFEYDFISTFKKLTAKTVKKVAFMVGHGEHAPYYKAGEGVDVFDYETVLNTLVKTYEIVIVDDYSKMDQIDTLVVAGAKEALNDEELFEIDQFIMNGGNAVFLADTRSLGEGMRVTELQTNLEKLTEHYGIKINNNFVLDDKNETVPFSSGYMQFMIPYPFWPRLTSENFNDQNPIVSQLEHLVFPWVSSLEITPKVGIEYQSLIFSGENSWTQTSIDIDPNQEYTSEQKGVEQIATYANGKFTSYFADKDIPSEIDETTKTSFVKNAVESSRIIVVGESDFITDQTLRTYPSNATFFLNIIDYLTLDSDLIKIRSKKVTDRPLDALSETKKQISKFVIVLLAPILFVIYGFARVLIRKRK